MQLSNRTWSEPMHNVLAHQLLRYYQPQHVPSMAWIALVMWYTHHKLVHTKILLNFWLLFMISKFIFLNVSIVQSLNRDSSFSWDCRIHWLHLCKGVRLLQQVSWMWHWTIWWWGSSNTGTLGNTEYSFIVITLRSTLARNGNAW